ncbi:MAG TPA: hypothetical protein VLH09_09130 [Bryobacteraceae bacterium]|nr:hypothetical protein [Bryobacteraceae bacterium]
MGLFPFNTNWARQAQTDVPSIRTTLGAGVMYSPGSPAVADVDRYFTGVMALGAYTLLQTGPDVGARSVTITRTTVDAADTFGTVNIVGTDLAGNVITETLTPTVSGTTYQTTRAFATVTSVTSVGWVIGGGADTFVIGMGDRFGLPDLLTDTAQVVCASVNNVREATAPTVTVSATVLSLNTVDPDSALGGTPFKVYYWL